MFKAFKEFAFKGNLIDMAVGIIIGGAFGTVVKSLVDNVVMPPIGKLIGDIDFSKLQWVIGAPPEEGADPVAIRWGQFIQDFISFIVIAFVIFIVIKKVVAAFEKKAEEPEEAPKLSAEAELLTEIRDQLKAQNG